MKRNPVLHRELTYRNRAFSNAILIMVFDGILAVFSLLYFYTISQNVIYSGEMDFSTMLKLYMLIATLEFFLFLLLTPALAAGSISGERERGTIDLLLTSKMSSWQIIWGKFTSSMYISGLLFTSSLPILSLVFVYGGVKLWDFLFLLLNLYVMVIFIGSISIFFSALFARVTVSMIVSYATVAFLTGGTLLIEWLFYNLSTLKTIGTDKAAGVGSFIVLLMINPIVTFFSVLERQTGEMKILKKIFERFGTDTSGFLINNWAVLSIVVQLLLSALLLVMAHWVLTPVHRRNKKPAPQE